MLRLAVATVALVAITQAEDAPARNRRSAERSVDSLFELDEDITDLENNVARFDVYDAKFTAANDTIKSVEFGLTTKINSVIDELSSKQTESQDKLLKTMGLLRQTVGEAVESARADASEVNKTISEYGASKLAAMEKFVADTLDNYMLKQTWSNYSWDPKFPRNYELIQVERAPQNTQNGHAKRIFYKVKFNIMNPGFWYPNRDELHQACSRLSSDLEELDGVDRALKPACDRDWACDGNGVSLRGAYLSNCGCGSRPRQRECVGMSEKMLGGACMYNRENSWSGCRLLRHDGLSCHHHWADCYARSGVQCEHTICTSSNNKWQIAPKNWCDPRDAKFCQK